MATILQTKSIYFNDVNLLPSLGKVRSRKEVPKELFRIIVSPMTSIVGRTFIKEAAKLGLSVAIPRFLNIENKIHLYKIFTKYQISEKQLCFIGISLNESINNLSLYREYTKCNSYLVDMANGYIPQIREKIKIIKDCLGHNLVDLLIGNIVTLKGLEYLEKSLNDLCYNLFVRVGIGNGQPCASSDVAAINRGQITELMECELFKTDRNRDYYSRNTSKRLFLVSDGGISKSGFVLKAFGAGADYCLLGGYWKNALEAEANVTGKGIYFGCASSTQNKLANLDRHTEGKEILIDKTKLKPLKELVDELWGGIASGISYVGYQSIDTFISNGIFELKINSLPPKIRY